MIPEQEIVALSLQKADDCLVDSDILFDEGRYLAVVNRSYYAVFYSLAALAARHSFQTSKHLQLLGWFNREFVKAGKVSLDTGRIAMKLFEQRMQGDYDLFVVFSREQVFEIKQDAADFVKTIRTVLL